MRSVTAVITAFILLLGLGVSAATQNTEQEAIDRFFNRIETKRARKLSWVAGSFSLNRINRSNDYNRFASQVSGHFPNASLQWLGEAKSFGLDLGIVFKERFAWSVGGEYWLKLGESKSGSYSYDPPIALATSVSDLKSEIEVWGITTGIQYYPLEHPTVGNQLEQLSFRVGGTVGYYQVSWDLWDDYQNLNLQWSAPEGHNIAFKGISIGYSASLGADYPFKWQGLAVGAEISYLYLNFKNVAWYNAADEEVIATYNGTADGRVDLNLSGVRGKIEVKRYFSW